MYCPNCGNDLKKDKFCTKCGYDVEKRNNYQAQAVNTTQSAQPVQSTKPAKSSKGGVFAIIAIVAFVVISIVVAFAAIFIFAFKSIIGISTKEFFEVSDYKIPSVYKVLGEKHSICNVRYNNSRGEGELSVEFCDSLEEKDIKEYVDYLIEKEGFELYEGSDDYNLRKEDDGHYVYIAIRSNAIGFFYSKESMVDSNDRLGV